MIRAAAVTLFSLASLPSFAQAQEPHGYATPAGVELAVTTGEVVFMAGRYDLAELVTLPRDVSGSMPGSMGIPFGFKIAAGRYPQTREDAVWTWFCAPLDRATAAFPGLGSVVRQGDCVGLRRRKADGRIDWVVDNSVYNAPLNTVWSRPAKKAEAAELAFETGPAVADATVDKAVTFDGFYGGLLVFTWSEGGRRRELKFDYDGKSEKMIGMLGKRMLVLKADSVELRYKWVAAPGP